MHFLYLSKKWDIKHSLNHGLTNEFNTSTNYLQFWNELSSVGVKVTFYNCSDVLFQVNTILAPSFVFILFIFMLKVSYLSLFLLVMPKNLEASKWLWQHEWKIAFTELNQGKKIDVLTMTPSYQFLIMTCHFNAIFRWIYIFIRNKQVFLIWFGK